MDLTPISATVPVNPSPASQIAQATQVDQVKEAKLAQAQSIGKLSIAYFSPVIKIDRATNSTIFQYRDRESGEITREFPSKGEIEAYTKDPVKAVEEEQPRYEEEV